MNPSRGMGAEGSLSGGRGIDGYLTQSVWPFDGQFVFLWLWGGIRPVLDLLPDTVRTRRAVSPRLERQGEEPSPPPEPRVECLTPRSTARMRGPASELEVVQINPSFVALINAQISLPKVVEFTLVDEAWAMKSTPSPLPHCCARDGCGRLPCRRSPPCHSRSSCRQIGMPGAAERSCFRPAVRSHDFRGRASNARFRDRCWTIQIRPLVSRINLFRGGRGFVLDMAEAQDSRLVPWFRGR